MDRVTGTVKFFTGQTGFIVNEEGIDVYQHISNIATGRAEEGNEPLVSGDIVSFVEFKKENGNRIALDTKLVTCVADVTESVTEAKGETVVYADDASASVENITKTFNDDQVVELLLQLECKVAG